MRTLLITILMIGITGTWSTEAQLLKKIRKRAERAAEEAVLDKVEQKTYEETEKTMDTILEAPGREIRKRKSDKSGQGYEEDYDEEGYENEDGTYQEGQAEASAPDPEIQVYSKFDFVPGDKLLFFDDFSPEFVGDFPSRWNTNGSGEIVSTDEGRIKWLELKSGYGITYIPDLPYLPEEFTIEFDVMALGIDQQTSSTAVLKVGVSDNTSFKWGKFANVDIPFCQYAPVGFFVRNGGEINNSVQGDIREKVLGRPHVSIAVNKQRFRLWVDESKVVDIPRMIPEGSKPRAVKFGLHQFKDGKERLFISNLKVAEGGKDLRRQLLEQGSISTNAILFDSGSDRIQARSMGVIRAISQVLQQDPSMQLQIIGHTDADGDDSSNLQLSKMRAEAVKDALVEVYGIDSARLRSDGKGESQPVADNTSPEGKAQNRRVEFVKL